MFALLKKLKLFFVWAAWQLNPFRTNPEKKADILYKKLTNKAPRRNTGSNYTKPKKLRK